MQTRALGTLALAATLAAILVALAHAWLDEAARRPAMATAAGPETVTIVVAARDLGYGDTLRAPDLKLADWPKPAVPPGAFQAVDSVIGAPGKVAPVVLSAIGTAEPIVTGKISGFGAPGRLGATIAAGMRAMTVGASGGGDMAALIGPGDRVDVLISREVRHQGQDRELRSDVLLRDVRVLGLDRGPLASGAAHGRAGPVTLEVTVEQAQKLAVAQKVGSLSLILRGLEGRDAGGSGPISSRDLPAGPEPRVARIADPVAPIKAELLPGAVRELVGPLFARPARSSVRVIRGLEASVYEVSPEAAGGAIATIDAAKTPHAAPGRTEAPR